MSAPVPVQAIALAQIDFDLSTQVRAAINQAAVSDYAERMKEGAVFPPVDLFSPGPNALPFVIADGWHRLIAAHKLGETTFPARVHQGTREDFLRFALGANANRGQPLTNADKVKAVETALVTWAKISDRQIAELCGVGHALVSRLRNLSLSQGDSPRPPTIGKDGKVRRPPEPREADPPAPSGPATAPSGPPVETAALPPAAAVLSPAAPALPAWSIPEAMVRVRDAIETEIAVCPVADWPALSSRIRETVAVLCAPEKEEPEAAFGDRRIIPPLPAWVTAYSASIGYAMDGEKWCDAYQAKGWIVGRAKMKDWQSAVRTWKVNGYGVGTITLSAKRQDKPTDYDHI